MRVFSFRNLRILVLLVLLALAAVYTKEQLRRSTSWLEPVELAVYPILGDSDPATRRYVQSLSGKDFEPIESFLKREAERYDLVESSPVRARLGPLVDEAPPAAPWDAGLLRTVAWSLHLRLWAWSRDPLEPRGSSTRVRMYVIYQQGREGRDLSHSLGLRKGLIGVVHAYADERQTGTNNLVIAHELLHTLGATDKYDRRGQPAYPEGYAEPDRSPLHPQRRAEIMAGKIPVSPDRWKMPRGLEQCVIGPLTAREIGWLRGEG